MGSLLMQFEYQNALAKQTLYQRKAIRLNNLSERYQKRIGQIEQLFSKKKAQNDSKFERMSSRVSSSITSWVTNQGSGLASVIVGTTGASLLSSIGFSEFGGLLGGLIDADLITAIDTSKDKTDAGELANYNAKQSRLSQVASQLQIAIKEIIDAMKEAEEARLEELEDAQLDPITQKDIQVQGDAAMYETLNEMATQRAEKAKARLSEDIKKSTAGYGLS